MAGVLRHKAALGKKKGFCDTSTKTYLWNFVNHTTAPVYDTYSGHRVYMYTEESEPMASVVKQSGLREEH